MPKEIEPNAKEYAGAYVLEDIADSGFTMEFLVGHLEKNGFNNINVGFLVDKDIGAGKVVDSAWQEKYVTLPTVFKIPNDWVIGAGLDWDYGGYHFGRMLPGGGIVAINPKVSTYIMEVIDKRKHTFNQLKPQISEYIFEA